MPKEDQPDIPPQHQDDQPGREHEMRPEPRFEDKSHRSSGRLSGRRVLITGGDSGIGRAVAVLFAKEGADVAIVYLDEHEDAEKTQRIVEEYGATCLSIAGDVGDPTFCREAVRQTVEALGGLDILVNNAAEQHETEDFAQIPVDQVERTFRTNILGMFWLTKEALPHLGEGSAIINSTSVTAYRGHKTLIGYTSTKAAIVGFTRALALHLVDRGIRVNGVAPGPVWTPLIPASFDPEHVASHGESAPMGRMAQPAEIAPSYLFLATDDASYITGQVLHPNGGDIVNA